MTDLTEVPGFHYFPPKRSGAGFLLTLEEGQFSVTAGGEVSQVGTLAAWGLRSSLSDDGKQVAVLRVSREERAIRVFAQSPGGDSVAVWEEGTDRIRVLDFEGTEVGQFSLPGQDVLVKDLVWYPDELVALTGLDYDAPNGCSVDPVGRLVQYG